MGLAAACMLLLAVVAAATEECPLPTAALHTRCCFGCWWWCWRCSLLLLLCCCCMLLRILLGVCMGATWDLHAASSRLADRIVPARGTVSLEPLRLVRSCCQLLSVVFGQFKTPWTCTRAKIEHTLGMGASTALLLLLGSWKPVAVAGAENVDWGVWKEGRVPSPGPRSRSSVTGHTTDQASLGFCTPMHVLPCPTPWF